MPLKRHLSAPLVHFRAIVSECPTYQTLVGAADAVTALPSVHYFGVEDQATGTAAAQQVKPFPRSLVALEDYDSESQGGHVWETDIMLSLLLEAETPAAQKDLSLADRYIWWLETVEGVIDDIKEIVSPQTRLLITGISNSIAPQRRDLDRTGSVERWIAAFVVSVST